MPMLIRFLLIHSAGGFALGLLPGVAWVLLRHGGGLLLEEPVAAALILWGFAASFALGAICTALAFLPGHRP